MKKIVLPLIFLAFINISNAQVRLNVMQPAAVNIGNHITHIAIIDRTEPEKGWVNILEGIVTGEGIGLDKDAREHTMSGLSDVLGNSPKFTVITTPIKYKTPLTKGGFPAPLAWGQIDRICTQYNCNAVLSLELFDSDFIVTQTHKEVEEKDKEGNVKKVKIYYAEGVGRVKIGYRIYDPQTKSIVDQFMDERTGKWNAEGKTPQAALASLLNRKAAVNSISRNSGVIYAKRITPHWITVYRHYYRRPKKDISFTTGVRQCQTDNWEGALENWLKASKSNHKKTAKRAMFNAALAYEVLGDLENAKKWAADSYTQYNLKKARTYVSTIENRMWQEKRLDEQMLQMPEE